MIQVLYYITTELWYWSINQSINQILNIIFILRPNFGKQVPNKSYSLYSSNAAERK